MNLNKFCLVSMYFKGGRDRSDAYYSEHLNELCQFCPCDIIVYTDTPQIFNEKIKTVAVSLKDCVAKVWPNWKQDLERWIYPLRSHSRWQGQICVKYPDLIAIYSCKVALMHDVLGEYDHCLYIDAGHLYSNPCRNNNGKYHPDKIIHHLLPKIAELQRKYDMYFMVHLINYYFPDPNEQARLFGLQTDGWAMCGGVIYMQRKYREFAMAEYKKIWQKLIEQQYPGPMCDENVWDVFRWQERLNGMRAEEWMLLLT